MMYKNLNLFVIFIVLNRLFLVVYGQEFIPEPRVGQTAVLVGNLLYYIGGSHFNELDNPFTSDFLYLNLSDTQRRLPWVDLGSQGVKFPLVSFHTANIGGAYQDSIFIIGGKRKEANPELVYYFDTKTNAISVPVIRGITPPRREAMDSVSYKGKIYLFNGQLLTDNGTTLFFNNFDILDTINLNWEIGSLVNAPIARTQYTATLVNETIYYIGGKRSLFDYFSMAEIYQYDIVGNTWSLKTATTTDVGTIPGPRAGHSSVLVDDRICIYGGAFGSPETTYISSPKEIIAILNTNTLVWSIPPLENPKVPKLAFHSATVKNKYMIITFGNLTDMPAESDRSNKNTYKFDLIDPKFKWILIIPKPNITTKPPITISPDTNINPQEPSSLSKTVIVSVSVGSVAVILALVVVFLLVYRRIKIKKIIQEPGHPNNSDPTGNK